MRGRIGGEAVDVFTINPRVSDPGRYWAAIERNVDLSRAHGATGVLCFSGNDTYVDPWLTAEYVARSGKLTPLVALNPVTMPPYSAAKMITSLAHLHGTRTALNLITGTSARDREVLCDEIAHDDRYARLEEYATIVHSLITQRRPTTFEGRWYRIRQALLLPRVPEELFPQYFLAGQSPAAVELAQRLEATQIRMLAPGLGTELREGAERLAVHFGVLSRATDDEAWEAAHAHFPKDTAGARTRELTMQYTDSTWQRRLWESAQDGVSAPGGYWLEPFRTYRSDCPFLVGSHDRVAAVVATHLERGVRTFVLDLLPDELEFENTRRAVELAYAAVSGQRA